MRRTALLLATLLALLAWATPVAAHVGAPYPVLLEEQIGAYTVSALADPDVGTGTFYILSTIDGGPPPRDTAITIWVQPLDGHRATSAHPATREDTRYGERFVAKIPFDTKGEWQVNLVIEGSAGNAETSFPVRVTPSGIGWLATLACLLPFAGLGALWLRGARRQGANQEKEQAEA
jgi:hypothetical protein